jgi:hypothetical protein
MRISYFILLPFMIIALACCESGGDDNVDNDLCQFDLPGTYRFKHLIYEGFGYGEYPYANGEELSGYFTFGNSTYKTEFEFNCDRWWVHPETGDSLNLGFYDCQIDSGTYTYTKELTDASRYGVWVFDIKFTSISGNTWPSDSHYYCSGHIEGRPELLLFDYQAPDAKTYDFVIAPI